MPKPPQYPTANTNPADRRKSARYLITGRVWFQGQSAAWKLVRRDRKHTCYRKSRVFCWG